MKTVERLRYFDGEYLRASDFRAEQAYHVEMRRRLNSELHLYGIVEGLDLKPDEDSFGSAVQFSITAGFGIDRLGREIVLGQPYALANDTVLRRQGIQAGTYELWICYSETETNLPAEGYAQCNDPSQQTRYREGFNVVLVPSPKPAPKKGETIPDPANDCGGLRLGTITVASDALGLRIDTATSEKRTYIGLRTQRIVAPNENAAPFVVVNQNVKPNGAAPDGYIDVRPGMFIEGNSFLEKNVVVGDDFAINSKDVVTPLPSPMPDGGNLKVNSNLFLNGGLFANIDGKWYGVKDYLQSFLPDFQFAVRTITVSTSAMTDPSNGVSDPFPFTSKLPNVTSVDVHVALNGIVAKGKTNLETWWKTIPGGSPLQVSIAALTPARQGTSPNKFDIKVSWAVGPKDVPGGVSPPPAMLAIDSLVVSFLVMFRP